MASSAAVASVVAVTAENITYLGQQEAVAVDEELMGPLGFSVDQLMELAGLSVACALAEEYPPSSHPRVLVVAGPGNNGGDGLVAARHLTHFGYGVEVAYPKRTDRPLYHGLVTQLQSLGLCFVEVDDLIGGVPLSERYDVIIDAMFGFSFKGTPRPPFDAILEMMRPGAAPPPIVAVDIPSGWDVEVGDASGGEGIQPDMLVSLTAPKKAARSFKGKFHYLGGRFVPPQIKAKYNLVLPAFPGTAQCVRIAAADGAGATGSGSSNGGRKTPADMRIHYGEGGGEGLMEEDSHPDPMQQFDRWFKEASSTGLQEPNAMAIASVGRPGQQQQQDESSPTPAEALGQPAVRMVLLKGYDERGFVFYTNYNSRKGKELDACGRAALCFWWEPLQKSVRVEGTVERVPGAESDEYFNSRPRSSRIGALVSEQSAVLPRGRQELEERAAELFKRYEDESTPVPRPGHWGGFLVRPTAIEFWQGRPSRLHDRLRYCRQADGAWQLQRLSP